MALMAIGLESNRTCIVSNISDSVDEAALRGFLGSFGAVEELTRMEGMGTDAVWKVVYGNESDAKDALLVHGTIWCGCPVEIKPLTAQESTQPEPPTQEQQLPIGLPVGGPGAVDPVTQAAFAAAQQAGIQTDQIPGAGITSQLLEVVRAQPELANSLIPLLKAHSSSSAAELGLLTRITEFHKDRAKIDAEKKHEEEKEQLRRELEELKRKQKEDESDRLKKKRRSSSYSSTSSRDRRRRRNDESASMTPPPPSAEKKGSFNLFDKHISETPTKHLYIAFPLGSKLPTLKGVKSYFDAIGDLTELKISKSLSSVFASFSNIESVPDTAIATLKEKTEFDGAQFFHAKTSFKVYQDDQQRSEKDQRRRRERRGNDRKSYERRDRRSRTPPRRRRRTSSSPERRRRRR
eukprot:TRINITY_DN9656_c0_g1_i1.p1 TRINITY_DN9656_c0_g1~~TRINITY_DN9656_c0_g1_i1.p1  ORF type:complete len:407 (+),score=93.15 TRINITY_DN9656_c0_g1_i1:71-1291(+)